METSEFLSLSLFCITSKSTLFSDENSVFLEK